jgi:hypothetical protein
MSKSNKLPGKTPWAGQRRPMTRTSGFSVSSDVRITKTEVSSHKIKKESDLTFKFSITKVRKGDRLGFGGWFNSSKPVGIEKIGGPAQWVCSVPENGEWGKFGSQWIAEEGGDISISVTFSCRKDIDIAFYNLAAGHVRHDGIDGARPEILGNMWTFAPEANFISDTDEVIPIGNFSANIGRKFDLYLKSCNRCGRFLPINMQPNERTTLSFSNHCVSRAPCVHSSFGRIQDAENPGLVIQLDHGFQLECRFCKKFFVNAPLNPQRSMGQMKEDSARRRGFELLLEHLNQGSPQLEYKTRTGRDLASDVFARFDGRCFKCNKKFKSKGSMHLDHTRPLALLWPLDEYATALCSVHNTEKRDRSPSDFYSAIELKRLSKITGLKLKELSDPAPNVAAVHLLIERLDWFFDEFLVKGNLAKIREGKATSELMVKALQKAINRVPGGPPIDLVREALRRNKSK